MERMVYHISPRGVQRGAIFTNGDDRQKFLDLLAKYCTTFDTRILSWVLMTNHYHLQADAPPSAITEFCRRLNHSYAMSFNRRNQHSGHAFEERSKAFERWGNAVLPCTAAYVFNNPVMARMVRTPADFDWSGYRAALGLAPMPEWQDSTPLLRCFSDDLARGRIEFQRFVESFVPHLRTVWRVVDLWSARHPRGTRGFHLLPAVEFMAMTSISLTRNFPLWEFDATCPLDEVDIQLYGMTEVTHATEEMMGLLLGMRQQSVSERLKRIRRDLGRNPSLAAQLDETLKQALVHVPMPVRTA